MITMKNFTVITFCLAFSLFSFSQSLTIGNGATITVEGYGGTGSDGTLTIEGDLTIENGGKLAAVDDARFFVSGDINYTATAGFTRAQSIITMNGTAAQDISNTANNEDLQVYDLVLNNSTGLTLGASNSGTANLGVFNVLTLTSGALTTNGYLTIESFNNAGTIEYGRIATHAPAISGLVSVTKTLTNTTTGWRQLSVPVTGTITSSDITLLLSSHVPANQRNTYFWDSTAGASPDYAKGWAEAASVSNAAPFFAFLSGTNGVHTVANQFSITGDASTGDRTNNLEFTRDPADVGGANADAKGWNFIANPWPAMVDIDVFLNDGTNFTSGYKAVHVWNSVASQYSGISASGISIDYNTAGAEIDRTTVNIPPMQAFWVKASAAGQVANLIESSMRSTEVLSTAAFMKTTPDHFRLNVLDSEAGQCQMVVAFDASSTRGFDNIGDVYYLASQNESVPAFYGLEEGSKASIVSRPFVFTDSIDVVYNSIHDQGKFSISPNFEGLSQPIYAYLKDRQTQNFYRLEDAQSLSFVHKANFEGNRFVIYFSKNQNTFENQINTEIQNVLTFVRHGELTLQSQYFTGLADVTVSDVMGRVLFEDRLNLSEGENVVLDVDQKNQFIVVNVGINGNYISEKMFY